MERTRSFFKRLRRRKSRTPCASSSPELSGSKDKIDCSSTDQTNATGFTESQIETGSTTEADVEIARLTDMSLQTVEEAVIDPNAEMTQLAVTARQDASRSNVFITGGDFPDARIGKSIQTQNITKYENCTIIHRNFYRGTFGPQQGSGEQLALPPHSSTKVVKHAGDDDYAYLENDIMIQRKPLYKGTKVFRGRQIHPCSSGGKDAWRDVAIKIVHASRNSDKEVRRLLDLAEHNNIVKILQSGKSPGPTDEIFIVMELCSKNLSEYALENRCNATLEQKFFLKKAIFANQLISGLQFIHSSEIVHGDLKPDNILFSMSGKYLKISDFGMSKVVREGQSKSSESGSGTDGFRAPELYVPEAEASYESDMFSFGIITFYLFTDGEHPYGDDPNDWSYNIRKVTKNPNLTGIPHYRGAVPNRYELLQLLRDLLEAEPSSRPTSNKVKSHTFFREVGIDIDSVEAVPWSVAGRIGESATEMFTRGIFHGGANVVVCSDVHIRSVTYGEVRIGGHGRFTVNNTEENQD